MHLQSPGFPGRLQFQNTKKVLELLDDKALNSLEFISWVKQAADGSGLKLTTLLLKLFCGEFSWNSFMKRFHRCVHGRCRISRCQVQVRSAGSWKRSVQFAARLLSRHGRGHCSRRHQQPPRTGVRKDRRLQVPVRNSRWLLGFLGVLISQFVSQSRYVCRVPCRGHGVTQVLEIEQEMI